MKIFLSEKKPSLNSHKWAPSLSVFNDMVLQSEATEIICDNFLSSFKIEELNELMKIIISKMRLNCELTVIETDAYLASRKFYLEEISLKELNATLFSCEKKSIIDMDTVLSNISDNVVVTHKHYDSNSCAFILKFRRVK